MKDNLKLPELEVKILNRIWTRGQQATVQEILDSWEGEPPLYTTVLKKLQVMEKKGIVTHKKEGKAYNYIPLVSREEVSTRHLGDMVRDLFGGDRLELVNTFIRNTDLKKNEIKAIREMLKRKEEEV